MDLQATKQTLGDLLNQSRVQLQVPPYQRPYAWGNEHIDDLWDDLLAAVGSRHFIGSIVLSTEDRQAPQIIDGQQRLTTLIILLGHIRDRLWALGATNRALGIQDDLLFSSRRAEGEDRFRIRLGAANWRVFRDLVLRPPDDGGRLAVEMEQLSREERVRNARLLENYRRLADRLDEDLDQRTSGERIRRLRDLEDTIVDRFELVLIKVGGLNDAFLLFETLNDRGLQLSAADLLKNHLLGRVAAEGGQQLAIERMASRWDGMLDELGRTVDLTRFFRHYLLVRRHPVAKEDVYDLFKAELARSDPDTFMTELTIAAHIYGDFEDPPRLSTDEPRVAAVLQNLQTLRAVRCYVALLPARRWLSSTSFVRVARTAEVLTYRYSSICGLDAKSLELVYHRAAKILDEHHEAGLGDALRLLEEAMPSTDEFKAAFNRQRMGVQYLLRYTLAGIEETLAPDGERPVRLDRTHIEHIMPQTLTDDWRHLLPDGGEQHEERLNHWGNLTLLSQRLNPGAGNRPFDAKKPYYLASDILLTRLLAEEITWDYAAIQRRQSWLAELADRVWNGAAVRDEFGDIASSLAAPPDPLRLRLPPGLLAYVRPLVQEATVEDLRDLLAAIEVHMHTIEVAATGDPNVDLSLAIQINRLLGQLIDDATHLDATSRSLVRAAAAYFALREDASQDLSPVGLRDDAEVLNAVLMALGRSEWQIPLASDPS